MRLHKCKLVPACGHGLARVAGTAVSLMLATTCPAAQTNQLRPGLIGVLYGDPDFTRPRKVQVLKTAHLDSKHVGNKTWSGEWDGFVIAPVTGKVRFDLLAPPPAALKVGESQTGQTLTSSGPRSVTVAMREGELYPINLKYSSPPEDDWTFGVQWSWKGKQPSVIREEALKHSAGQETKWGVTPEPLLSEVDFSQFLRVPAKHVMAYRAPGRFCGWPANGGCWSWDNEILVGFTLGTYSLQEETHSIDTDRPSKLVFARSRDGGETWTVEDPDANSPSPATNSLPNAGLDFTHSGLAIRAWADSWKFSLDRGRTWSQEIRFPFEDAKLTARTDYQALGPRTCLFFVSEEKADVKSEKPDRTFCTLTRNGGKTFEFLSWLTTDAPRSVMPSTVRLPDGTYVSALRRREDTRPRDWLPTTRNWIETVESRDGGKSWHFLSRVASTDRGERNGNPPSLVRLADGRLCVTYGYRGVPYGIRAKLSADQGRTWSKEILLRGDGATWDIGYTRSVVRPDGKIITIYYYATAEQPEQHIAATIWEPSL